MDGKIGKRQILCNTQKRIDLINTDLSDMIDSRKSGTVRGILG